MIDPANFPINYLLLRKEELLRLLALDPGNADLGLELVQVHDLVNEKITLYCLDALSDSEAALLADHMRRCQHCRDQCEARERELLLALGIQDERLLRDRSSECLPWWALVEEALGRASSLEGGEHLLRCARCSKELASLRAERELLLRAERKTRSGVREASEPSAPPEAAEEPAPEPLEVGPPAPPEAGPALALHQPARRRTMSAFTIAEVFRIGDNYVVALQTPDRNLDGARLRLTVAFPGDGGLRQSSDTHIIDGRALCKFEGVSEDVDPTQLVVRKLEVRQAR
ncbi:MAG: hypothetical protein HYV63_01715 [Candidatus Schekmanbacteria bacterium]|nr:hypothetical protein [Candidatus Schekmanbacteria bacterium]